MSSVNPAVAYLFSSFKIFHLIDHDSEDSSLHFGVRVEGIDELMSNTKFSRQELQRMYRGFKNVGVLALYYV